MNFYKEEKGHLVTSHIKPFKWIKYDDIDGWLYVIKIPMGKNQPLMEATISISPRELRLNKCTSIEDLSQIFMRAKFIQSFTSLTYMLEVQNREK